MTDESYSPPSSLPPPRLLSWLSTAKKVIDALQKGLAGQVNQNHEVSVRSPLHDSERARWQDRSLWRMDDYLDASVRSIWPLAAFDPGCRAANRGAAWVARRLQSSGTSLCHCRRCHGSSLRHLRLPYAGPDGP